MGVKEGNKEDHSKSSSHLKASSVRTLNIAIETLFHEMGSLTEKIAFLRSRRNLRWRNLLSCPRRSRSGDASNNCALRQATVEYVVGQDVVSAKPATLERKDFQSTMPVLTWKLFHAFDHMVDGK